MRKSVKYQLQKYLFGHWVFSTALLIIAVYVTRGKFDLASIELIGITVLGSAGFFLQLLDVWLKTETTYDKKKKLKHNNAEPIK